MPAFSSTLRGRLHRPVEVVVRLGADQAWLTIRARGRSPSARGLVLVHQQHRGGAVGDLRRRAGGVDAALEHRLQRGQALERGVAQTLVAGDDVRVSPVGCLSLVEHRRLDAADLAVEAALGPRLLGLALRVEAELVDVLAGDAAPLGDPLGGVELVGQVDVPRRGPRDAALGAGVGAERRRGSSPRRRRRCRRRWRRPRSGRRSGGGLLAAAALAVDRGRADVLGQPGVQPARPG